MTGFGLLPPPPFPLRLLICGDRDWVDGGFILATLTPHKDKIATVIHGAARGADTKAAEAAEALGIPVIAYPAAWSQVGRAAGPLRNCRMLYEGKPDFVLAFHDNIGNSSGTADMLYLACQARIPRCIVSHAVPDKFARMLAAWGQDAT